MSNIELKPCPFCGGEARMMKMGYPHWVYCLNCGAKVHGRKYGEDGEKASAEAWNRRVTEPNWNPIEWLRLKGMELKEDE